MINLRRCDRLHGDTIDELASLSGLKSLTLSYSGFKRVNIGRLTKLHSLQTLAIESLALTDTDIEPLTKFDLIKLYTRENQLTNRSIPTFARIKTLRKLFIGNPKGVDLKRLREALPDCEII